MQGGLDVSHILLKRKFLDRHSTVYMVGVASEKLPTQYLIQVDLNSHSFLTLIRFSFDWKMIIKKFLIHFLLEKNLFPPCISSSTFNEQFCRN